MVLKIAIAGKGGVSKSTLMGKLKELYPHLPTCAGGDIFRIIAKRRGVSPKVLEVIAKDDQNVDREIDESIVKFAKEHQETGYIVEGRLVAKMVPEAVSILLHCDDEVRFVRIAGRDNLSNEQARSDTLARESATSDRYVNLYGFTLDSCFDPDLYDETVDTRRLTEEEVKVRVSKLLLKKHAAA